MCMKRFGKWASAVLAGLLLAVPVSARLLPLGDVDGDGSVTRKDAMILRRYYAGWEGYDVLVQDFTMDINADDRHTEEDADEFSRYFAGVPGAGPFIGYPVTDLEFRNIMIVATDEGSVGCNGLRTPSGTVGFKIIQNDGSLDPTVYYTGAADLGLHGHMEEQALGAVYTAAFTIEGNNAVLDSSGTRQSVTVMNNGLTDNDGMTYANFPIQQMISSGSLANPETLKLFTKSYVSITEEDPSLVKTDEATGNLLYWDESTQQWCIGWYYHAVTEQYYRYITEDGTGTVSIDWMSDEEYAAWYRDVTTVITGGQTEYVPTNSSSLSFPSPYARLRLFDLDGDRTRDIGLYDTYAIGILEQRARKCSSCGKMMPTYVLSTLENTVALDVFAENGHQHCDHGPAGFAWISTIASVSGFMNEDGSYNNGIVLYNYDQTTGELSIAKYISPTGNNADADSFIATGLLQGYSTVNTTVTINGMKYLYGYDSLPGNTLRRGNGSEAAQSVVKAELDKYVMAIVTYLVVDGKVVDIDLLNSSSELISVIGYAGITSDGYVAVHATSTANPQPMIYRILSFNGASSVDDPIYNPETSIAFQKGTIYTIKSYEPDTDSYSVNTHTVADLQKQEEFSSIWINLTLDNGYAVYTNGNKEVLYSDKISGNQDFLIIDTSGNPYCIPGTSLKTGYWVQGTMLLKTPTLVVIEANPVLDAGGTIIGHMADGFLDNAYTYEYIRYDEANAFTKAPDLSSNYDLRDTTYVNVYDLAANAYKYVLVPANIDLVDGQTYEVLNNMIIGIAG